MRVLIALLLALAVALPVAACGKKPGQLEVPEGSEFPRRYPSR